MSSYSETIETFIKRVFCDYQYQAEYTIQFRGTTLRFDFYIPQINLLIEVQGEQHYKYVEFFHKNGAGYRSSLYRDQLKKEWCSLKQHNLVYFSYDNMPQTEEEFKERILEQWIMTNP